MAQESFAVGETPLNNLRRSPLRPSKVSTEKSIADWQCQLNVLSLILYFKQTMVFLAKHILLSHFVNKINFIHSEN